MRKRHPITLATVRRLALSFPGVEEGLSYGTPGFRVRGKFLARFWEDGEKAHAASGRFILRNVGRAPLDPATLA